MALVDEAGAVDVTPQAGQDVIVVGGGLAGLACAVALSDRGLRVRVLEGSRVLGGRARSWIHRASGDAVDIGPHVVHSEYRNFLALLRRLGTHDAIEWQPRRLLTIANANRHGAASLCHRRGLTPPLSLLPDMARASRLPLRDLVSNNRVTLRAMTYDEADVTTLDRMTGLEMLRACRVSESLIDWFWRFASMAVMNVPLERVSAAALLRVHSQLIGHRGIHFGFPRVALGDLYVPSAVAAIQATRGRVETEVQVVELEADGRGQPRVRDARGQVHEAAHVVLAVPPLELRTIRAALAPDGPFEPSPYKCLYLWFDRKLTDAKFWSLLWAHDRYNYDFYDLSNIRPALCGRPSIVTSNMIYSGRVEALSDDELVAATLREIAIHAPSASRARIQHASVHHVPMAIPAPVPGFERFRPDTRTSLPRVYLAGDWTRTRLPCSMESAVRSGFLAAEAVLRDRGLDARLAVAPRGSDGLAGLVQKGAFLRRALSRRRRRGRR
jgi:squalene-associated FAD-dependent desaturase